MENVTLKDVASLAGVSHTTVSLVVNEATGKRVGRATRERVMAAVRELKYNPNLTAKRLASGKMHAIGLYTPFKFSIFRNFTFLELLTGIQDVLSPKGFDLVLFSGGRNLYKYRPIQQIVRESTVDGLIIFNTRFTNQRYVKNYIDVLKELNFNFVVVDYYWGRSAINYVGVEYEKATLNGMKHLLTLGHRKIALLGGSYRAPLTAKILKAYQKALQKFDVVFDEKLVAYADYDYEQAYSKTILLLEKNDGITAFFVAGFEMAPACLKAVREMGFKVPQDVSILCYVDDQIIPLLDPPLTAIQWPYYKMGKKAAQILIEEKKDNQKAIFDTELKMRGSTSTID